MKTLNKITAAIKAHTSISGEISIRWCNDEEMRELNHQFRGVDKPTNVLAFPANDINYLGDIAISLETVMREAKAQSKEYEHHLAHMVVHGVLHLLGHDHEDDADADAMEALEIRILGSIGIANPYTQA